MVCSKSASVSPGKPTMMSVVMRDVALGRLDPAHALQVPVAGVLAGHGLAGRALEPDCTGRWTWSQSVGVASMASTMSRVKSRGCEVVKRTRRMPGTLADGGEQFGEADSRPTGRGSC